MKAEFFILGVLHRGDFHPYEMKRRLNNALVECYTDVDVGTLYYAFRQLIKSGDIAPKRKQKVTRGVARTIYPALLFLDLADLPAVAELLHERLRQTESALAKTSAIKKQLGRRLGSGNSHLMDHLIQIRQLDCRSLRRLL